MAKLFKNQQNVNISERQLLQNKFNSSRANILLVVAFTIINVVLLVTNSNTYFLFSAYVPYAILDLAMFFCGKYPAEYYAEIGEMHFLSSTVFFVALAVVAVILLLYFLSWLLSKKGKAGWVVVALVLFVIDTAVMFILNGINADMIIDIVFHAWVLISLVSGIMAYKKLKALPEETEEINDNTAEEVQSEPVLNGEATNVDNN